MSWLSKIVKDLSDRLDIDVVPRPSLTHGDILYVDQPGQEVRTVTYGTPTDGDVLTVSAASPTGWVIAPQTGGGGGGGVTTHNALTSGSLIWTASAHTGTAGKLAGFSGAGAAVYYTIGSDVQAFDAGLTSLTGVDTAANLMGYTTAANTWASTSITATARSLLDDTSTGAMLTTLGAAAASGIGYLLMASDASLTHSRLFQVDGTSIASVDTGPGGTWTINVNPSFVFLASGASHRVGLVPDPPAVAGTDKVLCENATWVTSASVVRAALIGPPKLVFTEKCIEYMLVSALSPGTTAFSQNAARHDLHYEEHPDGATYDAIHAFSATGVGLSVVFALYSMHATTGAPDALLWISTASSANVGNTTHTKTFASDGTWQAAGASYKDGSNRLRLLQGQGVWKASMTNGSVTMRALNSGQCRNIGIASDGTVFYQGYTQTGLTYPTFPATATPAPLTTQVPILPLRWV